MLETATLTDDQIHLQRFAPLHLVSNTPKGRGVFAGADVPRGTVIDTCPALVLSPDENDSHISRTSLYHYTYTWPLQPQPSNSHPNLSSSPPYCSRDRKAVRRTQAVIFGLGSLFNHSSHPHRQNVGWRRDLAREIVVYTALREIRAGEELCISYGEHLTFKDVDGGDRVAGADGEGAAAGAEDEDGDVDGTEGLRRIEWE